MGQHPSTNESNDTNSLNPPPKKHQKQRRKSFDSSIEILKTSLGKIPLLSKKQNSMCEVLGEDPFGPNSPLIHDVKMEILKNLTWSELGRYSRVSKTWQILCNQPSLWQNLVEQCNDAPMELVEKTWKEELRQMVDFRWQTSFGEKKPIFSKHKHKIKINSAGHAVALGPKIYPYRNNYTWQCMITGPTHFTRQIGIVFNDPHSPVRFPYTSSLESCGGTWNSDSTMIQCAHPMKNLNPLATGKYHVNESEIVTIRIQDRTMYFSSTSTPEFAAFTFEKDLGYSPGIYLYGSGDTGFIGWRITQQIINEDFV